jgi:hypothetical protein
VSKFVPLPQVSMLAVPEADGVHWKTCSGEVPVLPQLAVRVLLPLVVPPKVPPCAGMIIGLLQAPGPGGGGVTLRLNVPCAPP